MNSHQIRFDADLIRRYDRAARATRRIRRRCSSPTSSPERIPGGGDGEQPGPDPAPLSLYVHIPFCSSPCFYCGCTKVITRNHEKAEAYLYRLHREIELQSRSTTATERSSNCTSAAARPPSSLARDRRLIGKLGDHFKLSRDPDPSTRSSSTAHHHARHAARPRARRLQSLQPRHPGLRPVGAAGGEPHPVRPDTLRLIREAREFGFNSVSVDLIYGLPKQNLEGFARTSTPCCRPSPTALPCTPMRTCRRCSRRNGS